MNRIKLYWLTTTLFALLLSACGTTVAASPSTLTAAPPSTSTPTPVPLLTETPAPTFTPLPTATPIPHPLEISAMRAREYPGSDIVIEAVT